MSHWPFITTIFITTLSLILVQPAFALQFPGCETPVTALQYNPVRQTWSFSGTVLTVRHIHALGMPGRVAQVQSDGFKAWVYLDFETGIPSLPLLKLGHARPGDQVLVSLQGPQALPDQIDWRLCQPQDSRFCQYGRSQDTGPFSPEWDVPISPSNEFIHYGHPNPSWEQALFWNTKRLTCAHSQP